MFGTWEQDRQLLGVAVRQQLRMPALLAAAVSPNRCCPPTDAASPSRLRGSTSQIRVTELPTRGTPGTARLRLLILRTGR